MKDIYCLAIESSCDETSMSIIKNGNEEIKTIVNTQIDIHKKFGGVVPEVASRSHIENITIVLEELFENLDIVRIVDYYKDMDKVNYHALVPNYLKLPQAMENR